MSNNITGGRGRYDLYIATRPDLNSLFGNVNGDGKVDLLDMMELIDKWLEAAGWSE